MKKNKLYFSIIAFVLLISNISFFFVLGASYTKQDFSINNESRVFLELESNTGTYNGSISVTVNIGVEVTAEVNNEVKVIKQGETKIFTFTNISAIIFTLSAEGAAQGFFELSLNVDYNTGGNRALYITLAVLGGTFFLASVISYYIRSKKLQTKPEEQDEEMTDPETLRKRREAAGAEKRFWGLDKD